MDDDVADRLDNLDLAVTQIADALEVVATLMQGSAGMRYELQSVIDQLERARQLIGTSDDPLPVEPSFE